MRRRRVTAAATEEVMEVMEEVMEEAMEEVKVAVKAVAMDLEEEDLAVVEDLAMVDVVGNQIEL